MSTSQSSRTRHGRTTGATRRRFLKSAAAGAGIAALSATGAGPLVFVREARAADKELKIIQWSHFVPAYDKWFDQFVRDWGVANGVKATVDHIPHLEIPARMAAEVSAKTGHELFGVKGAGGPRSYRGVTVE